MTIYNWATAVSGDWGTAANWTPAVIPNDGAADVTIDAPANPGGYTVTISAGESETVNSLAVNPTNNFNGTNTSPQQAAEFDVAGTLVFAAGSAGHLSGSLQTYMVVNGGTIVNPGTVDAFIQAEGQVLFTGTNGFYVTNWLQSLAGTVTVDTSSIAEMTGNTLFDGIYEAKGTGAVVNLGGPRENLIVNIATVEGPPAIPEGWTELILNDPAAQIQEWNGSAYRPLESTLTDIGLRGTVDVLLARNYTTANTLSLNGGLLNNQGGTFTAAAIDINTGAVQGNGTIAAPIVNNATLMVEGGTLAVTGPITGTGLIGFDTDIKAGTVVASGATAVLGAVAAGQTLVMHGNDKLVVTTPAAFLGHIVAAPGDQIILPGQAITSAIDTNGTLVLSNGGTVIADLLLAGSYAAGALTANGSIVTIGSAGTGTGTITPPGTTIAIANGGTQTVTGTGNTINAGSGVALTVVGASNVVTAGTGGSFSFNGGGEYLSGSNETVTTTAPGSAVTLVGNNNTIAAGAAPGSVFGPIGTGNVVNASGVTVYAGNGSAVTVTGTNDVVGFSGPGSVTTSGNTIFLAGNAAVAVTGSNNAIGAPAGTSVTLNGTNNSVYGSGATVNGAPGSTVFIAGPGNTANFGGVASVAMSGGTINATGTAASISIGGDNNVVNDPYAGSVIGIKGTGETVNASGITVYCGANSSITMVGTNDVLGTTGGDRIVVGSASNMAFVTGASGANGLVLSDHTQRLSNFNPAAGDRLDLSQLLAGDPVTAGNIDTYVQASWTDNNTTLNIVGSRNSDTVVLAGGGAFTVQTLLNENAFILPT